MLYSIISQVNFSKILNVVIISSSAIKAFVNTLSQLSSYNASCKDYNFKSLFIGFLSCHTKEPNCLNWIVAMTTKVKAFVEA